MFGAHLSIAGGLVNALIEAQHLRMDCVQVFTRNQRQWAVRALEDGQRDAWLDKLTELGWHRRNAAPRTISHASYLINLASPDGALWRKSVNAMRAELERCEALKIPLCVVHPGAHLGECRPPGQPHTLGADPSRAERAGLRRVIRALDQLHAQLAGYRTVTCLETTAGAGSTLGYDFRQLADVRANVGEPDRVAFCFDTCHVTAAGYDMTTDAAARAVIQQWDHQCGRRTLRVFHINDSAGAVGSRKDRHAHIGHGCCGASCFRAVLNCRGFERVMKILETPKGTDGKGVPGDIANIRRLKRLARRR